MQNARENQTSSLPFKTCVLASFVNFRGEQGLSVRFWWCTHTQTREIWGDFLATFSKGHFNKWKNTKYTRSSYDTTNAFCLSQKIHANFSSTHGCRGCRDDAVVRALASHQCGPGSIPRSGVKCGLSLLLLFSAPRGFLPVLRFPLSSKTKIWLDCVNC